MSREVCLELKFEWLKTRSFLIFANNLRSKQNLKYPGHAFVDTGKWVDFLKAKVSHLFCIAERSF